MDHSNEMNNIEKYMSSIMAKLYALIINKNQEITNLGNQIVNLEQQVYEQQMYKSKYYHSIENTPVG